MCLAIIPARGGSKRIPAKNVRLFRGQPIISYPIKSALASGCFSEVMVSTDDATIAELAVSLGASVPFLRSAAASSDHATTGAAVREVLEKYRSIGREFSLACCLYATAALVSPARLREAFHILQADPTLEGVMAVVRTSQPAQRALVVENSRVQFLDPNQRKTRTQDLPETFLDAAQMYWLRTEPYLAQKEEVMSVLERAPLILSEYETQDINTEEDWQFAELKHAFLEQRSLSAQA